MLTPQDIDRLSSTTLVIIADSIDLESDDISWLSKRLDQTERRHVEELVAAILPRLRDLVVYTSPSEFIDHISLHKDHIILPDWGGANSWSRYGLIPAVCEAYNTRFIGADAYTKIVCQDKFLTKAICRHVGLDTPHALFIDVEEKFEFLSDLTYPCVVKPCYEGSSIGIDDGGLVYDPESARDRARMLLSELKEPVLAEAFCPGREISICIIGNSRRIRMVQAGERYIPADEGYFRSNIFTFDMKKNSKRTALRLVTDDLPGYVFDRAKALFRLLQKVDFMRIDGRLDGERFSVLELTPDTHLGARAEFAGTFLLAGMTYADVISEMILNSLDNP